MYTKQDAFVALGNLQEEGKETFYVTTANIYYVTGIVLQSLSAGYEDDK